MRLRPITLKRFGITCAVLSAVVWFAVEQASAQDATSAPAKQVGTQVFNPKEYLKKDSRIEKIKVELATRAGDRWSVTQVQTKNGEFDLGVPPTGEYELRFTDADGHSDATANRGITISSSHVEYGDADRKAAGNADPKHNSDMGRLTVTLMGVDGGTLKQELQAQLNGEVAELSRPGKTKFKNIVLFKADGRSQVKGTLRHDASVPAIRNTR